MADTYGAIAPPPAPLAEHAHVPARAPDRRLDSDVSASFSTDADATIDPAAAAAAAREPLQPAPPAALDASCEPPVEPLTAASRAIDSAAVLIEQLRQAVYQLEEARHAVGADNAPAISSEGDPVAPTPARPHAHPELDALMIQLDSKLEATHHAFMLMDSALDVLPPDQHDSFPEPPGLTIHPISSSTSLASLTSATSFDDELWAAGDMAADVEDTAHRASDRRAVRALRVRARAFGDAWSHIQDEVEVVRRELVDDKQQRAFAGVVAHAHELMDSLSRALDAQDEVVREWLPIEAACLAAVAACSDPDESGSAMLDLEAALSKAETYGADLNSVGRKTDVKLSYYVPSVQRAFAGLSAMLTSRNTSHGGAERMRLAAVERWDALTDRTVSAARERRRTALSHRTISKKLMAAASANADADPSLAAAYPAITSADVSADMSGSFSLGDISGSSSIAFPSMSSSPTESRTSIAQGAPNSNSSTPRCREAKLPASLRTQGQWGGSARLFSAPHASSPRLREVRPISDQSTPSSLGPRRPPRDPRRISDASTASQATEILTPDTDVRSLCRPSTRPRGSSNRDSLANLAKALDGLALEPKEFLSSPPRSENRARGSLGLSLTRSIYDDAPPLPNTVRGTSPVSSTSAETATTTTTAPSLGGRPSSHAAKRASRIPRIPRMPSSSLIHGSASSRPGSTRPPSSMSAGGVEGLPRPPSSRGLSLSTPRTPRTRGPPPASRSAYGALAARAAPRTVAQTPDPLIAQRAQRMSAFNPVRRSAPSPQPHMIRSSSLTSELSRPAWGARAPSVRPGSRMRPASRIEGPTYGEGVGGDYKPNPLDELDVAVGGIANAVGVSIARLEPPLGRGQRVELGPGKEAHARYALAGRPVICKILELHRPGAAAQGPRTTRKTMVRAEGFWQDLETWLLTRIAQQQQWGAVPA